MKIYAHRANLNGPGSGENTQAAIEECLKQGFCVEIDVRGINKEIWVGHDKPLWKANHLFLKKPGLICHAKNIEAAVLLHEIGADFFCLEKDTYALCSNGLLWTNYGTSPTPFSIMCSPELVEAPEMLEDFFPRIIGCYGVCTDYPLRYLALKS